VILSNLILYKREIKSSLYFNFSDCIEVDTVQKETNRTVCCKYSVSIEDVLYKRVINRTVCCKFSESIEVDTVQKRNK